MTSVAINAAPRDDGAPPGLGVELARDPADLWQTMSDAEGKPCRHRDPDEFFPLPGVYSRNNDYARRVCATNGAPCPVRAACLAYALKTEEVGEHSGIWGGMSARERHALRLRLISAGLL